MEEVWFGIVGVDVKDGEKDHLAADEDGRDAVVDVIVGKCGGRLHSIGGVEDGKDDRLDEGEKNNALDGDKFSDHVVLSDLRSNALVERQQADESQNNRDGANDGQLCTRSAMVSKHFS